MKFELTLFWFMVATTPLLLALSWWSKMKLDEHLSRPIKELELTPELEQAINLYVRHLAALCRAIEAKKQQENQ